VNHKARASLEVTVGVGLLLAVAVGGLYLMIRPGPTVLDRWIFTAVRPVHHSGFLLVVTRLGSPFVVVAASVAGFLATIRRNRPRAGALLAGPVLAVAACDWVIKPVVDRTFAGVVSFPSGTVAAVAAVATVGLVATPDPWRAVTAALGGTVTVLAAMSVVALRWHYPTDALAGVAVGGGVVLVADCVARAVATRVARARAFEREPRPDAEQTLSH
jgi:membrane-associated phospholipid phosphatase